LAEQSTLGYLLVAAFVFLGLLIVCVPRLRRPAFKNEDAEEKYYATLKKKAKAAKKKSKKKTKKKSRKKKS